jgi:preprotein translocase YajC subunit
MAIPCFSVPKNVQTTPAQATLIFFGSSLTRDQSPAEACIILIGGDSMFTQDILIQLFLVLGVLIAAYLFLIRPQLKRITEHDLFLSSLKLGDRVVTGGGLIGTIVKLEGTNIVEIELSKSVRVQAIRSSIESKFRE